MQQRDVLKYSGRFSLAVALAFLLAPAALLSAAGYTAIPDTAFEQSLINQKIDSEGVLDGRILTSDMASATVISSSDAGISNLSGIKSASMLGSLNASSNQLQGILDLSGLSRLVSVDVTQNPDLVCIQVDDVPEADSDTGQYAGWSKDPTALYSQDCSALFPGL